MWRGCKRSHARSERADRIARGLHRGHSAGCWAAGALSLVSPGPSPGPRRSGPGPGPPSRRCVCRDGRGVAMSASGRSRSSERRTCAVAAGRTAPGWYHAGQAHSWHLRPPSARPLRSAGSPAGPRRTGGCGWHGKGWVFCSRRPQGESLLEPLGWTTALEVLIATVLRRVCQRFRIFIFPSKINCEVAIASSARIFSLRWRHRRPDCHSAGLCRGGCEVG